jgi:hypothetical protein
MCYSGRHRHQHRFEERNIHKIYDKQHAAPTTGPTENTQSDFHFDTQIACLQKTADFFSFATGTLPSYLLMMAIKYPCVKNV